ncbi:MAG: serine/threonine-protein kinase [Chloroflexi bacterium]|nr:serine/threonine-protein kinase [Chloroflexota bacterium]MDA1272278.1 serine/threonine-protein kinase [Chloroflexota bacterium]PKB58492.1 MAG: hypothetical protein BZY83_06725 [SAR202 cluster bacterium Casp-Chloro-G2]
MKRERKERAPILEPGFWLDDDLRVIQHLGGSRKVDVYSCSSKRLDMLVSCKVLRPEYCIDFSALDDIRIEGELLLRLHHPNVVEGYGMELEEYPRIIMEHLQGVTVESAFLSGNFGAFDYLDAVDVALDVARGLTHVHQQGLLHLDVKPANVMYHEGHATLFDFSVAEEFSAGDTLRDDAGTTEYMAPEQTAREEVGYYTDVFGLGVLFYRLLSGGAYPYPVMEVTKDTDDVGNSGGTKSRLDYGSLPVNPSVHNPNAPEELGEIALRAVQVDKSLRFATPEEFSAALEKALKAVGGWSPGP